MKRNCGAGEHAARRRDQDRHGAEELLRSPCRTRAALRRRPQRGRHLPRRLPPRGVRGRRAERRAAALSRARHSRRQRSSRSSCRYVGNHIKHLAVFTMVEGPGARRQLRQDLSQVAAVPDQTLAREGQGRGDSRAGGVDAPRSRRGKVPWPRRPRVGDSGCRFLSLSRQ